MDKYLKNGEEMFKKYCCSAENRPVMLPRAPQQTYIDVYPDGPGSTFENDKQRQSDYEAEVLVYRALEKLKEHDMIVLHGFKYTHHQYRLCDKNHERKGCFMCKGNNAANVEGECDFLIIYRGMLVIIEVKNVRPVFECDPNFHLCVIGEENDTPECGTKSSQVLELNRSSCKSLKQREKVEQLIKSLDENAKILSFTAYPNLGVRYYGRFQDENLRSSIIFKEDIQDFAKWWNKAVSSNIIIHSETTAMERDVLIKIAAAWKLTRNMLLAIWATDRDSFDLQKHSLGCCIKNIDEKLRTGKFVFREKNPNNVAAPRVIRDYLKVENLTQKQYDVLNSDKRCLWINGPAGSGKSVILAGRIIQQALNDRSRKIVVILFRRRQVKSRFLQALLEAKLQCNEINFDEHHNFKADHPNDGIKYQINNESRPDHDFNYNYEIWADSDNYETDYSDADSDNYETDQIKDPYVDDNENFDGYYDYYAHNGHEWPWDAEEDNLHYPDESDFSYLDSETEAEILYEERESAKYQDRATNLSKLIRESKEKNQITIVYFTPESGRNFPLTWLIENLMESLGDCSFFIDDVQAMLNDLGIRIEYAKSDESEKINRVLEILSHKTDKTVQVTCDVTQSWFRFFDYGKYLHKLVTDRQITSQMVILSTNLRNTRNIAELLSKMRDLIVKVCHDKEKVAMLSPKQSLGHFIHGPKVEVHLFSKNEVSSIGNVLSRVLNSLCNDSALGYSEIGMVYDFLSDTRWDSISYALSTLEDEARDSITLCDIRHSFSAEFPAVIIFHEILGDYRNSKTRIDDLRVLYLAVSRARVYCSIILFPSKNDLSLDNNYQLYLRFFTNVDDVAHLIRY